MSEPKRLGHPFAGRYIELLHSSQIEIICGEVASRVRYTAAVLPNDPVEDCASFGQPFERSDLIGAHETAVALDICCEDCDEATADFRRV